MDLGLKDREKTKKTVDGLNTYLSDLMVLFVKLHNYHWNIVGDDFFEFHEKLQELYEFVGEEIDRIGERILMLGYKPVGNLDTALRETTLNEANSVNISAGNISENVISDFSKVLRQIRDLAGLAGENNDEYTIVLLGDAIGFFEKNIWMFSAYLSPKRFFKK